MLKKATRDYSIELEKNLPLIKGSFQKLEQVFINLITNACHALKDNSRKIAISTSYDQPKEQILIRIKDEGEGIAEKDLKYITDPFYTTKRDKGGTGLGLFISFNIIQGHGGTIRFDSAVGKGTTVSICLPVKQQEEDPAMGENDSMETE